MRGRPGRGGVVVAGGLLANGGLLGVPTGGTTAGLEGVLDGRLGGRLGDGSSSSGLGDVVGTGTAG